MKKKLSGLTCFKLIIFVSVLMFAAIFLFACESENPPGQPPLKPAKTAPVKKPAPPKAKKAEPPIRVGVAGAYTGELASIGIPPRRAAEIVIRQMNAKGGIFNRKIEMIVEDDVCNQETAAAVASRFVEKGVNMVLGHTCSGATKAALEVYKAANIVVISASATNPDLTQSGAYPNFFRTISPDDAQAKMQVKLILDTLKLNRIAVLHDQDDYGKGLADFAVQFLKQSDQAQIVLHEQITSGADNYGAIVNKIKDAGAEAVVYGGYHPEAAKIITEMRMKKMDTHFISGDGVKNDAFIKAAAWKHAEGVYVTGPRDTSDNPLAIAAIKAHKKEYNAEPGAFFLNAYAGAMSLFNAIRKSGSLESDPIQKFLRRSHVETPLGTITFDGRGDVSGYGFSLFQVKNGVFAEVQDEKKSAKKTQD